MHMEDENDLMNLHGMESHEQGQQGNFHIISFPKTNGFAGDKFVGSRTIWWEG